MFLAQNRIFDSVIILKGTCEVNGVYKIKLLKNHHKSSRKKEQRLILFNGYFCDINYLDDVLAVECS